MREFIVTLRTGRRHTVRADRVALLDRDTLALVLRPDATEEPATIDDAVAVFDRGLVVSVVAADHQVAEADIPDVVAVDPTSDIPF